MTETQTPREMQIVRVNIAGASGRGADWITGQVVEVDLADGPTFDVLCTEVDNTRDNSDLVGTVNTVFPGDEWVAV